MDTIEPDVLAHMAFPVEHRTRVASTKRLERLNREIERRTRVVGIVPDEAAVTRLVGATVLEQSDESVVERARYLPLAPHAQTANLRSRDRPPQPSEHTLGSPEISTATWRLLHHVPGHDATWPGA